MKRVLVIECDGELRSALVNWLTLENFDVVKTEDNEVGFQLAQEQPFDVVIWDAATLTMRELALLRSLHETQNQGRNFILILLVSKSSNLTYALNLGADGYLLKSLVLDKLLNLLTANLKEPVGV
ncbi:response regulator [Kovacikia minuta CCNUW1]|uniref:response regulator n=1 Tax=Kovacikia minuta TaxID=2931930 RepID=UPI001CCF3A2A|nr:response regulator [Kovacikia minuta]UBF29306.1 response regulator [Kovacikia minuta CCNUW1]